MKPWTEVPGWDELDMIECMEEFDPDWRGHWAGLDVWEVAKQYGDEFNDHARQYIAENYIG